MSGQNRLWTVQRFDVLNVSERGDSHVPGPPETVVEQLSENTGARPGEETVVHSVSDGGSIIIDDSGSETESYDLNEEYRPSTEDTDSSDADNNALRSSTENTSNHWESDEDPAPNLNSVIIIERESDIVQEPSVVTIPESPNIGVENPIIRLENPDYDPDEVPEPVETVSTATGKRSYGAMMSDEDDGQTCPVCLELWTNSGLHRLSALKCGHLFGKSCISRWLSLEKKKYCPQCNKKAHVSDIRELYVTKLVALDATEKIRLENELDEIKAQRRQLELELLRSNLALGDCKQQLELLKSRLASLEGDSKNEKKGIGQKPEAPIQQKIMKFYLEKTYEIHEGSCRVAAHSQQIDALVVSHQIRGPLLRGYGVRKIIHTGTEFCGQSFFFLHSKVLRDLCFHPTISNLLLSVSFDKTAKLLDLGNQTVIQSFKTSYPLWSCCWDDDDSNIFYTGAGNGIVSVFDRRYPNSPVACLNSVDDPGAVVALRYASAKPPAKGIVICCRLNSIVLYEKMSSTEYNPIPLTRLSGPFFSLSFDPDTRHLLVSCRPSESNRKVKHIFCELIGTTINKIFSFYGGNRQTLLCRSCLIPTASEILVAAFQEDTNSIELWNTSTGLRFQSIPISDHVSDLVSIKFREKIFLGVVSNSAVRFFQGPTLS